MDEDQIRELNDSNISLAKAKATFTWVASACLVAITIGVFVRLVA